MKNLKCFTLCCILFATTLQAQITDVINSNRPGESQMPFSVGRYVLQVETGGKYSYEKHEYLGYEADGYTGKLDFRMGFLLETLEFIGEIEYQKDEYISNFDVRDRAGIKNLTAGVKYLIYDPFKYYERKTDLYSWKNNQRMSKTEYMPSVAVYGGAHFALDDSPFDFNPLPEPTINAKAGVLIQNKVFRQTNFVTNVFYDRFLSDAKSINYIITLTQGFNYRWSGFIENQGYFGDYYADQIARAGLAFLITPDLQVDASAGTNFKNTPQLFNAGIGLSWRLTRFHKPQEIEKNVSKAERKQNKRNKKKK